MVQYAWTPGKAGTDATKLGDSPSPGAVDDISCPMTLLDWGRTIEFCNKKVGHSEQHVEQAFCRINLHIDSRTGRHSLRELSR